MVPDAEATLIAWLPGVLASVYGVTARVCAETPADLASEVPLVRLYRIGGSPDPALPGLDKPVLDVDCFAASRQSSGLLARQVHDLMRITLPGTVTGDAVCGAVVTIAGPRWLAYGDIAVRRFNATYQIMMHAAPA